MNITAARQVLDTIKEYDRIIIFRHFRPDGDAVGSTKGLRRILQLSFPEKEIVLQNCDFSDYLSFLGDEEELKDDAFYAEALGIVIDTATAERISNKKFSLCKKLIKIDHHIDVEAYGDINWVEEHRSSSCELVAAFYNAMKDELKIDAEAATYLYAGLVTDSGRFRFRSVSGETMRLAGMLLDQGVDTDHLYANLYMKEFEEFKFQGYVLNNIKITENGVAYIYIDRATMQEYGLSYEQASACVSYMDSIKNSLIWIAFIDSDKDEDIRVRLRSRFVTVNQLAEKYEGGGHACASGATVHSLQQLEELLSEADALLGEYKRSNEGWL
ncbi:MAG: bifunctional oligoribonuclease/PAP phosphatase NrnA [Ruminococcaceae bacterium]|nr:bifunctional oligoribonuclease/PAP phosphatase NrnA [Oscillospiraceae bacterium]